ncbi:LLM class flavin-dependent oxidoreductase [Saccharothrix algeriensis]|uniref:Alkanesulfonate monooxygenase n=1 Tax=Saccharothrix algeriensis TaxID=173560 RepID=A0A8T8HYK1_9PSEU|nr:LLM class flavin-dependent oxidoreductase [Saccharothrix algeriensis]MBM7815056.1 alkanesulfonate monooxygenase [Saccharothrix algeriensis]QTR03310.1 LLM class flavin-dependent oxidoreductase [Saccharothrix algeriensis]
MEVEFIGYVPAGTRESAIDLPRIREGVRRHEEAGYDTVLIGYGPDSPDPFQVAAYAAAHSSRIRMLLAHRAGVVFPTVAARMIASLDHFTGGRISLNLVPGGTLDTHPRQDGDYLSKDERYARTGEYLRVLKAAWTSPTAFSHHGEHYRFDDYEPHVRPLQRPWVPLYVAGSSPAAQAVAGAHADCYACYGEPLARTAEVVSSVRAEAARAGRSTAPCFVARFTVVLGEDDDHARERARQHVRRAGAPVDPGILNNEGNRRLKAAASAAEHHDRALWTVPIGSWGSVLNALVGSPRTVADALLDYVRLGVTGFRISGISEPEDTVAIGRELIPLVRSAAAGRGPGAG